jgi:hypothetical protein
MLRIIEDTPDRLVLRDRPWGIPALCVVLGVALGARVVALGAEASLLERGAAAMMMITCFAMAWVSAASSLVIFDRRAGNARWTRWRGLSIRTRRGEALLASVSEVFSDSLVDEEGRVWRLALRVDGVRVPLTDHYTGDETGCAAVVAQSMRWLAVARGESPPS